MPFEIAPKTEEEQRVAIGRIALEAIAAHILTVPPEKFDMAKWCGTACCAIGHGMSLPEVQITGLRLDALPEHLREFGKGQDRFPAFGERPGLHELGSPSIARAFGITEREASMLFSGIGMGSDAQTVSGRIRQFLDGSLKPAVPPALWFSSVDSPRAWITVTPTFHQYEWNGVYRASEARKIAAPQPAKKTRTNSKTGATWPVARGCYA